MTDPLEDHEGTVSTGGRTITNLCFADELVSLCFEPSQPTKDYIRAEHKLHSITKIFIPQVFFTKPQLKFYPQFWNAKPEKRTLVLEPIYIP